MQKPTPPDRIRHGIWSRFKGLPMDKKLPFINAIKEISGIDIVDKSDIEKIPSIYLMDIITVGRNLAGVSSEEKVSTPKYTKHDVKQMQAEADTATQEYEDYLKWKASQDDRFLGIMDALETQEHKELIECIKNGYRTIYL